MTVDEKALELHMEEISRKKPHRIALDPDCLSWEPQVSLIFFLWNFESFI